MDDRQVNKNAGTKICAIFVNCPDESFTLKEMIKRTGLPEGTVKSRIFRLYDDDIIKRYKIHPHRAFSYKLKDRKKAVDYIEGRIDRRKSSEKRRDTPTPLFIKQLDELVPQIPHHKIQQVKLTDEEWKRTEHLFTKPKDNKDRGRQRILERKTFKIVISQNTLKGALYILEDNWKGEVQELYPELAEQIYLREKLEHIGISFDADIWQNFRLQSEDMKLAFATSHMWREIDVEGREVAVNSFMKYVMANSFEKTTYDAIYSKLIEQILVKQEGFDERAFQMVLVLQNIDERLERMEQNDMKMVEILDRLTQAITGDSPKKKETENDNGIRELTPDDMIMFG